MKLAKLTKKTTFDIMKPKSQKAAIFSLLNSGIKLDLMKAFKLTGTMKLAARVSEFRNMGCNIEGEVKHFKTKFGTAGKYMEYSMKQNKSSKQLSKYYVNN
jgi:hypothetical protein